MQVSQLPTCLLLTCLLPTVQLVPHHTSLQGVPSDRALVPVALTSEQRALRQREEAEEVEEYEEEREARRSERAMVTRREAKHVALSEVEEAGRTSPGARAVDFGGARRPRRLAPRDGFGGRGSSGGGGGGSGGGGRGRGGRDEPPEPASQSSEEGSISEEEGWSGGSSAEGDELDLSDEVSEVSGDSEGGLPAVGRGTRRTLRSAGPAAVPRASRGRRERRRQRRHEQQLHTTRRNNRPARGGTARARYDEGDGEYGWIDHYDGPSGRRVAQLAAQERRRSEGGTGGTGSTRLLRRHAREGRRGGSTSAGAGASAPPPLTGGEAAAAEAEAEAEAEAAEAAEWEEVASRGAEWLLRTEPPSAPSEFVPMVGDEMVYLRQRSAVKTAPWLCLASAAPAPPQGRTSGLLAAQHSQRPGETGPFGAALLPRGLELASTRAAYSCRVAF